MQIFSVEKYEGKNIPRNRFTRKLFFLSPNSKKDTNLIMSTKNPSEQSSGIDAYVELMAARSDRLVSMLKSPTVEIEGEKDDEPVDRFIERMEQKIAEHDRFLSEVERSFPHSREPVPYSYDGNLDSFVVPKKQTESSRPESPVDDSGGIKGKWASGPDKEGWFVKRKKTRIERDDDS